MEREDKEKVLKIFGDITKLTGENTPEILNEAFKMAGLIPENYKTFYAPWNYKHIKENDFLVFDMDDTELKDGEIYLLKLKDFLKSLLLYGEYREQRKAFCLGDRPKDFIKVDKVVVLGKLSSVQKYSATIKLKKAVKKNFRNRHIKIK